MTSEARLREALRSLFVFNDPCHNDFNRESSLNAIQAYVTSALEAARREARLEALEEAARYVDDHFSSQWTGDICDGIRALASRAAPLE
jgi:hypothetical protein